MYIGALPSGDTTPCRMTGVTLHSHVPSARTPSAAENHVEVLRRRTAAVMEGHRACTPSVVPARAHSSLHPRTLGALCGHTTVVFKR